MHREKTYVLFKTVRSETMGDFEISLTVFKLGDLYYAVYSPGRKLSLPPNAIFTLYATFKSGDGVRTLEALQNAARNRARRNKIIKVHGLD